MTDNNWQDAVAEIWQLFKETDARLAAQFAETDARMAAMSAETDRKFNRLEGIFGMQWGRFVEALVRPGVLALFQAHNIAVENTYTRATGHSGGETMELDLLLVNGTEIVVVEVKNTVSASDVSDFLTDLSQVTRFFPRYKGYTIYGAVAGLEFPHDVRRYAYKQGLFVLAVEGEGLIQLKNDAKFQPKNFGGDELG
jgi:hypothetical protein